MFDEDYIFNLIIGLYSNLTDKFYKPCFFIRANLLRELS